ncbi:MAG TPA: hypothetical protein VET48_14555, partial [Steroidobacteraceae bacterium]|nr:hypothetical protein [Steroidobacteraceae bacterium]
MTARTTWYGEKKQASPCPSPKAHWCAVLQSVCKTHTLAAQRAHFDLIGLLIYRINTQQMAAGAIAPA